MSRRNEQFSALAVPDFVVMGHPYPAAAGRLWVVMAAEVAVAESAAGGVLDDMRAALAEFADIGRPRSGSGANGGAR